MSEGRLDVIVAGAGRVGLETAAVLDEYGHSVTIVERDRARCEAVSEEYVATLIRGDATDPEVLRQADPGGADVIAALTGDGGTNLGVCYVGMHLADGAIRTIARIDHEGREGYREIVDEVIFPERLGALGAANAIVGADVRAIEDITGELRILEVRIQEGAPVADQPLSAIALPRGSIVISDAPGDRIAGPETVLEPGETYIVATEPDVADEVLNLMHG